MPAIVTNKFRLSNAEQYYESFSEASTSYYLFVGRPLQKELHQVIYNMPFQDILGQLLLYMIITEEIMEHSGLLLHPTL